MVVATEATQTLSFLRHPLWEHQQRSFAFVERLWDEHADGGGAMLALSMGVGKTLVSVALILQKGFARTLILCPKTVVPVWAAEFAKHTTAEVVICAPQSGSVAKRAEQILEAAYQAEQAGKPLVVVVNYEASWQPPVGPQIRDDVGVIKQRSFRADMFVDRGVLAKLGFDCLVLDESHRIKAWNGRASQWAQYLADRIPYRLALTGTPMPHSPLDLWSQMRVVDPGVFGTHFFKFRARYAVMGGYEMKQVVGFRNEGEMNEKFYSRALRITKDEVLDLPPFHHVTRACTLSKGAERLYRKFEKDLRTQVDAGTVTIQNGLTKLLRLQQVTSGYVRDDRGEDRRVDHTKEELLEELLEDLPSDEFVVVFAKFQHDLDVIHAVAAKVGRASLELSGRHNQLREWQQAPSAAVLAVQIQAGGVGIDLTRARYCVYYSQTFGLGDYDQSLARTHRPGQTRPVTYFHLLADLPDGESTVDQTVYDALSQKRNVVQSVLERRYGWIQRIQEGS